MLFEFGPSRSADLAFRERVKAWQPKLRTLFLLRGAAISYRLELPGFELPPRVEAAQVDLDNAIAASLEDMANRLDGSTVTSPDRMPAALNHLEDEARASGEASSPHLRDFLALARAAGQLTIELAGSVENPNELPRTLSPGQAG